MKKWVLFIVGLFVSVLSFGQSDHYVARIQEFGSMRVVDSTDVVMIGNALTEYAGDWNVLLKWRHVRNRGIAGDDAAGIARRLSSVLRGHPKAIFLMAGGEDIMQGRSVEEAYESSVYIINLIRRGSPKTRLFVESNLPVHGYQVEDYKEKIQPMAQLNVRLRKYCSAHHIAYINLFRDFVRRGTNEMRRELTQDGYLLTPFGYKLWAFEIKKYLVGMEEGQ